MQGMWLSEFVFSFFRLAWRGRSLNSWHLTLASVVYAIKVFCHSEQVTRALNGAGLGISKLDADAYFELACKVVVVSGCPLVSVLEKVDKGMPTGSSQRLSACVVDSQRCHS